MSCSTRNKWESFPLHLTDDERANPLSVIEQFFTEESDLPLMIRDLDLLHRSAFSNTCLLSREEMVSLIDFREFFTRLIEASSLLTQKNRIHSGPPETEPLNPVYFCKAAEDTESLWKHIPKYLTWEEYLSPYKYIREFFSYKSLPEWREALKEWFSAAISRASIFSCTDDENIWTTCFHFYKLLEAIHLIFVRNGCNKIQV